MIEIILRKEMERFEPKPIFGHSRREALTYLAVGVVCGAVGYLLIGVVGLPFEIAVPPLLALGAAIGFVGFGRPHGLTVEEYIRIRRADASHPKTMPYGRPYPTLEGRSEPEDPRERKEIRADRRAAKKDWDELVRLDDALFSGLDDTDETDNVEVAK